MDIPGAILASLALLYMNRIENHRVAISRLFQIQLSSITIALLATLSYLGNLIDGMMWQILLGMGIYLCYSLMQTPVFERLFAVTHTTGTCTFLVFLSDGCGYVLTLTLLFYQNFGSPSSPSSSSDNNFEGDQNDQVLHLYMTVLVTGVIVMWV